MTYFHLKQPHSLQIPCYSLIGLKKFPDTSKNFPVLVSREFDHKVHGLCGIQSGQRAGKAEKMKNFPVNSLVNRELPMRRGSPLTVPTANQSCANHGRLSL